MEEKSKRRKEPQNLYSSIFVQFVLQTSADSRMIGEPWICGGFGRRL
jgi:hypothetical protein